MMDGLKRFFGARTENGEEDEEGFIEDEQSSFVFNEHMRIVAAIIVVVAGALCMWWIVA